MLTRASSDVKQSSRADECVDGSEALIAAESGVWKEMRGVRVVGELWWFWFLCGRVVREE